MDTNEIHQALRDGLITVNFTKVNGTKRTMIATLNDSYLPKQTVETTTARDPNLLVVWDTEHNGWRTIKVDSIIEWAPGENSVKPVEAVKVLDNAAIGWVPNK
jgi:hypothetical protein